MKCCRCLHWHEGLLQTRSRQANAVTSLRTFLQLHLWIRHLHVLDALARCFVVDCDGNIGIVAVARHRGGFFTNSRSRCISEVIDDGGATQLSQLDGVNGLCGQIPLRPAKPILSNSCNAH